jgi:hypothetical protein
VSHGLRISLQYQAVASISTKNKSVFDVYVCIASAQTQEESESIMLAILLKESRTT